MPTTRNKTIVFSQLVYDGQPIPYPLGLTDDLAIAALLKRTLIEEAKQKLRAVKGRDDILAAVFESKLEQLVNSLDMILATDIEDILLVELRERITSYLNRVLEEGDSNV